MTTAYVDYTYYTTTYLGTDIASANFSRLALRASAVIDRITFNRAATVVIAATDTTTIDSIKMATCAVAEEIQRQEADGSVDGIASESVGNHSVSYAANSSKMQSNIDKSAIEAATYLASTTLLYRGFASGEYSSDYEEDDE